MAVITLKNIQDCYAYGKRIAEGEIEISTASKSIANTGMDKGSAQIYLKCVQSMIQGERYTGTVKEMAVQSSRRNALTSAESSALNLTKKLNRISSVNAVRWRISSQEIMGRKKKWDWR